MLPIRLYCARCGEQLVNDRYDPTVMRRCAECGSTRFIEGGRNGGDTGLPIRERRRRIRSALRIGLPVTGIAAIVAIVAAIRAWLAK